MAPTKAALLARLLRPKVARRCRCGALDWSLSRDHFQKGLWTQRQFYSALSWSRTGRTRGRRGVCSRLSRRCSGTMLTEGNPAAGAFRSACDTPDV